MYLSHFALTEAPFSIAPDPRYLYMSQRHQEALAHLLYGLSGDGGFVLLSGEVGAGKTTVCRCLLAQIPPTCDLAYIFNPKLTVEELLATLCSEFGILMPANMQGSKALIDALNAYLLDGHARGRHAVLIIDEAQNLSADVLEQMRLLTNLETDKRKLLQIILVGQPELDEMLARPSLRQLAQRVVARYHLDALSRDEVAGYIQHRLQVAGGKRQLFPSSLNGLLYRLSGGVPRLLNLLCDRALLGAYTEGKNSVSRGILRRAAREVLPAQHMAGGPHPRWWLPAGLAASVLLAGVLAASLWPAVPVRRLPAKPAVLTKVPQPVVALPAKPVVVATPAPRLPDIPITWPAAIPLDQSQDLAFASLYQAWGQVYDPASRCQAVATLRCRLSRGSLDELRQINRPAVLYLSDSAGQEIQATLVGLDTQTATLKLAGIPINLPLTTLAQHWTGRYALLWRAPATGAERIRPGEKGLAVSWLAEQLHKADGLELASNEAAVFDAGLRSRLRQFQLSHGLAPDGQAGTQTLIRLSGVADSSAPRLLPEG